MSDKEYKEWILFFQTPAFRIKFITNELDTPTSLGYHKFVSFLFDNFRIVDTKGLMHELDSFQTVLLNGKTGQWKIEKPEINISKYSFEELYKLQVKKEEKEKEDKSIRDKLREYLGETWKEKQKKLPWKIYQ